MQDKYSLHNIVLVSKLFVIEAELLNKIGRHLLHLIIRKGLAKPRTNGNDIVLALHKAETEYVMQEITKGILKYILNTEGYFPWVRIAQHNKHAIVRCQNAQKA